MHVEPGLCFYMHMNRDKRKYHVVCILDKEDEPQIVYKYFGIHKRWWHYEIQSLYAFNMYFESGLYSLKRKKW